MRHLRKGLQVPGTSERHAQTVGSSLGQCLAEGPSCVL